MALQTPQQPALIALASDNSLVVSCRHPSALPDPAMLEWPGWWRRPPDDDGQHVFVTTSDWVRALGELAELGTRQLFVCGPELFSRADALHLLAVARADGLRVSIFTDVTGATPHVVDALAALDLTGVWLTLYGARPETHDALAGAGSFDHTMEVLRSLRARQQPVRINALLAAWDLSALADLVELAGQTDCPITSDALVFPQSPSEGAIPRPALWVMPDGAVRPCRALGTPVGMVPQDSIADLWRASSELQAFAGVQVQRRPGCRLCLLRAACFNRPPAPGGRV